MNGVTQERLKELFYYDAETGVFTRRVRSSNAKAGAVAGSLDPQGYWRINVGNRLYMAHRLAWLYVYGKWPKHQLDHVNGVRSDNSLANLREATGAQNVQNIRHATSKSGSKVLGAHWSKRDKAWRSSIRVDGKQIHLGSFKTADEANAAYLKAKAELHPFQTIASLGVGRE